ncbi:MAG: 16S rRNA (adenine(1518)-N(6)/adenine(1519)-N(6))-dimethyltransferase RsmA [Pseudomonadota bacterium]|nr:MAG: 16S rRNA (adenine(1518)-N(6)/adenine(1519)-N(6))-dimethyltransferase RsmA [Pseudomonadota bacterium]
MRPAHRKRFGQHFLHDRNVVDRILVAFQPQASDHVIEIGPGPGVLTRALVGRVGQLEAVEIDRDLAARLRTEFTPAQLTLHQADALDFDFCGRAPPGGQLRLIGNLPYNISTPLLFHLIEHSACTRDMLFMLQKEVVERLAARPGGKDYGRLTVMIQWRLQVEKLFEVASSAFRPPPKVASAVVRLRPHSQPPIAVHDPERFSLLVRRAFAQRRKTLRNTLKGLVTAQAMQDSGIDPARRAETLSLQEFARLADAPEES